MNDISNLIRLSKMLQSCAELIMEVDGVKNISVHENVVLIRVDEIPEILKPKIGDSDSFFVEKYLQINNIKIYALENLEV